ncbi:uracil-DNA glycosylase [Flavimaricola marinus]|nr:uracil-DNA glycosylase [Flavimaricola marinus]
MESETDPYSLRALLQWQIDCGADEAILDAPVDRYALEAKPPPPVPAMPGAAEAVPESPVSAAGPDPVAEARLMADAAQDLPALAAAIAAFPHCELQKGARSMVFADGQAEARLMIVGEAPGREEDRIGRPFVGQAGQLLDRMLAAIGMARDAARPEDAVYITNVLPWRPPGNRTPEPAEIAMMLPFLERHVALAKPDILVLMGNTPCQAILGRTGITRIRGQWTEALGIPVLPMFHPAYLLRQPLAKREAWADLLALKSRLMTGAST